MIYIVRAEVRNNYNSGTRVISPAIAGCKDEADAKLKMSKLYDVVEFRSVSLFGRGKYEQYAPVIDDQGM